jgi:hypothetical protein
MIRRSTFWVLRQSSLEGMCPVHIRLRNQSFQLVEQCQAVTTISPSQIMRGIELCRTNGKLFLQKRVLTILAGCVVPTSTRCRRSDSARCWAGRHFRPGRPRRTSRAARWPGSTTTKAARRRCGWARSPGSNACLGHAPRPAAGRTAPWCRSTGRWPKSR